MTKYVRRLREWWVPSVYKYWAYHKRQTEIRRVMETDPHAAAGMMLEDLRPGSEYYWCTRSS
jgi:hypothetical protein